MTPPVVVFDLDGTLTHSDTSVPFLRAVAGPTALAVALAEAAALFPADLAAAVRAERANAEGALGGISGRLEGRLHERLTRRLLRGRTRQALAAAGAQFAAREMAGGLRSDTLACVAAHRAAGHRLWLVSASLDVYLQPLAAALGMEGAIGTALHYDGPVATGAFAGLPCWGREKVRRLRAALGDTVAVQRAYGNGRGDAALLGVAAEPVWVAGPASPHRMSLP